MKKKYLTTIICLLSIFLVGCNYPIPDGPVKDFVERLNFDLAYQHVNTGKSIITAAYYVNEQIDGRVSVTTYIDKTDETKYFYSNTDVFGSFIGDRSDQYTYNNQQILAYLEHDDIVAAYKKTDDTLENIQYRLEDLNISINNFFYSELESGYHRGGVYYGDYVLANCGKFYSSFSLNEEKNQLHYQVNTLSKNSNNEEILTMHNFVIDEYGMIINLSSKSIYKAQNVEIETTIECAYNIEIEKLAEL